MRTILLLLILLGGCYSLHATTIKAIVNNGNWNTASSWDLGRIPQAGDTVDVRSGITILVSHTQSPGDIIVEIFGTLFFQSSGVLDLGSASEMIVFAGGVVTGSSNASERIKIGGNIKYQENVDGTFTGPGYLDVNTPNYNQSGGGFQTGVLPIVLESFTAAVGSDQTILISWITATEDNACCFTIWRSNDLEQWDSLTSIAAAGNSNVAHHYSSRDTRVSGGIVYYYRLRLMDKDGKYTYSQIVTVHYDNNGGKSLTVWPNPVVSGNNSIYVSWNGVFATAAELRIYTADGRLISREGVKAGEQRHFLSVKDLAKGLYFICLQNGNTLYQQKMVVR